MSQLTRQLPRLTTCVLFEINSPIWNGGRKMVGLNIQRIGKHNEIHFTYRRKSDGQLSIPDTYYFDGDKLEQLDFQHQAVKGVTLVLVPFTELELLEREI